MRTLSRPRLGLCPIGKFVFSHEDALKQKEALQAKLREWEVDVVDLDGVIPDGMVRDQAHVDPAVAHLRQAECDALFLPHCNFGTEGAAGMIARQLNLPTLLWGPRDEAPLPDGSRLRDSLCGMFATSKVLRKLGVPFSYIENCRLNDAPLQEGLDRFLRAAHTANVFRKGARIGIVGQRIDFFWTTIVNESELLEAFNIEILPLDLVTFIEQVKDRMARGAAGYAQESAALRESANIVDLSEEQLACTFAMRDQLRAYYTDHGLDALTFQSFPSVTDVLKTIPSYAGSMVGETHSYACEADIHGAISNLLLERAAYNHEASYLVDVTARHPEDDNGVLLWHVAAPNSMKAEDEQLTLDYPWILKGPISGLPGFRLRSGHITLARFDGDTGDYQLAIGEGDTMDGPRTKEQYAWLKVNDWPAWERALMEGPFIHHMAMQYGTYGHILEEACRFIPGLSPVRLP